MASSLIVLNASINQSQAQSSSSSSHNSLQNNPDNNNNNSNNSTSNSNNLSNSNPSSSTDSNNNSKSSLISSTNQSQISTTTNINSVNRISSANSNNTSINSTNNNNNNNNNNSNNLLLNRQDSFNGTVTSILSKTAEINSSSSDCSGTNTNFPVRLIQLDNSSVINSTSTDNSNTNLEDKFSSSSNYNLNTNNNNNNSNIISNNNNNKLYISTHHVKFTNNQDINNNNLTERTEEEMVNREKIDENQSCETHLTRIKIKYINNNNNQQSELLPSRISTHSAHFQSKKNENSIDSATSSTSSLSSSALSSPSASPSPETNKLQIISITQSSDIKYSSFISDPAPVSIPTNSDESIRVVEEHIQTLDEIDEQIITDERTNTTTINIKNVYGESSDFCIKETTAIETNSSNSPTPPPSSLATATPIIITPAINNNPNQVKAKKRVSFNDSLVQIHLIPNVSSILNVEKYRFKTSSFNNLDPNVIQQQLEQTNEEKSESEIPIEHKKEPESRNISNFIVENNVTKSQEVPIENVQTVNNQEIKQINSKYNKSSFVTLKSVDSDVVIVNDLKKSVRSSSISSSPQLNMVKLSVIHSADLSNRSSNQNENSSPLAIVGNFSSSRNSATNNRNQRLVSATTQANNQNDDYIDTKPNSAETVPQSPSTNIMSFSYPKPPRYLSATLRIASASSSSTSPSKQTSNSSSSSNSPVATMVSPNPIELSPQLKFLSNLKKLKPTSNFYNSGNLIQDQNNKSDFQQGSTVKENSFIVKSNRASMNNQLNESVKLNQVNTGLDPENLIENLNNLTELNNKQNNVNNKNSSTPTKFIFLKSDDKANEINNTGSNLASRNQLSFKGPIEYQRLDPKMSNFNNRSCLINSVNQLVALKDVNYYLANTASTKSAKKHYGPISSNNNQSQYTNNHPVCYSQNGIYSANGNTNRITNSNTSGTISEVSKIKMKSGGSYNFGEPDFRRTHSALPLLRSGTKNPYNQVVYSSSKAQMSNNNSNNNNNSSNANNSINSLQFKLVNAPVITSLSRAKTFLYNQNGDGKSSGGNGYQYINPRIRGNSIDKTTM